MQDLIFPIKQEVPNDYFDGFHYSTSIFKIFEKDKEYNVSEWLSLPNYSGYRISPNGEVWSLKTHRMIPSHRFDQYKVVSLYADDRKRKTLALHVIVAKLYVRNPKPGIYDQVNHLDGDKLNCKASNLRWTDALGNTHHAIDLGLWDSKCEGNGMAKLHTDQVEEILRSKKSNRVLADQYGVNIQLIRRVKNRETWKSIPTPRTLFYNGKEWTFPILAKLFNLKPGCLKKRLKRMSISRALTPNKYNV